MTLPEQRMTELNSHLMLFYSGIKRTASNVADSYVNTLNDKRRQLRIMKDMVDEAISILSSGQDIRGFGELLHEAWQAKRSLSGQVSNSYVDELYETARKAGAIGGKLIGAGGGGFVLLFVPPERQQAVRDALTGLICVPFKFEFSGSQIIFCDRQADYRAEEIARAKQTVRPFEELRKE
jgi:D-glycero-alpha-D-manno-heptose-7-phosphate kinase